MRPLSVKVPAPVICTSDSKVARGPGLDSALAWTPFAVSAVRRTWPAAVVLAASLSLDAFDRTRLPLELQREHEFLHPLFSSRRFQSWSGPPGRSLRAVPARGLVPCPMVSRLRPLRQERPGLLEVDGVDAVGEPAADRCQDFVPPLALAETMPHAAYAHGGAQLQGPGLLVASNRKGLAEAHLPGLGGGGRGRGPPGLVQPQFAV